MLIHSVQQYSQLPETCTCQSGIFFKWYKLVIYFHFFFLQIEKSVVSGPLLKVCMFISQGCSNKVPQTGWLKIIGIILPVLVARSLKSRCQQGHAVSEGSRGESLPCLSLSFGWWLSILGVPWLTAA